MQPHELLKKGAFITDQELSDLMTSGYKEVTDISSKPAPYIYRIDNKGEHWLLMKRDYTGIYKIINSTYEENKRLTK